MTTSGQTSFSVSRNDLILMALEDTRRTGRGRLLEVPLVEPGLTVGADLIIDGGFTIK